MKKKLMLIFLFCGLMIFQSSFAQPDPIKFGKISREDFDLSQYDIDTTAEAVIICDYGASDGNQFTRLLRVKILKESGYHWGDWTFRSYSKGNIRGYTYNLEKGQIVKTRLENSDIHSDDVYWYQMRVAMPNVKVGSVIDIEYTHSLIPFEWYFQQEIPVLHSELRIGTTPDIAYQKNSFGIYPLDISTNTRWVAINVPAFKREPYIASVNDYIRKFEFDIHSIANLFQVSSSWDAVNNILLDASSFGVAMRARGYLRDAVKAIKDSCKTDEAKMRAAVNYVKQINWNDVVSLSASTSRLKDIHDDKAGNSGDINLMLVGLLQKLGFEAYPLAISTRSNGQLDVYTPSLSKLNYVLAVVKRGEDDFILLDGTEKYLPWDVLPARCLNQYGRIIDYDAGYWVEMPKDKREISFYYSELSLDLEGVLEGKLSIKKENYAGKEFKQRFFSFNSKEEYMRDFESDNPGFEILDCELNGMENPDAPATGEFLLKVRNKANLIGEQIYINPFVLPVMESNPMVSDVRKYPIDFGHPIEYKYIANISIPEGFEVSEIPQSVNIVLPGKAGQCSMMVSAVSNRLMINFDLKINKTVYETGEYALLKEFFNQSINKQNELIVLKSLPDEETN